MLHCDYKIITMREFGLIGYPLSHSFSKKYFTQKFADEAIPDCRYELFPLEHIDDLPQLLQEHPHLAGLNVTIPYKQAVFQYMDEVEESAAAIGAINVIKVKNGCLKGYNSDAYGFQVSLEAFLGNRDIATVNALVLGTGGASKAVQYVLQRMQIPFKLVSRTAKNDCISYAEVNATMMETHHLIINTTPLGMAPNDFTAPSIPYNSIKNEHCLYDLVYNPEKTLFLSKGEANGARICNGLSMLHLQAERSWQIWNE